MENFQLYRTNILLGGQMKWDLILDSGTNGLSIRDFHLTPVSNNIPYTYQSDENLLLRKHEDNVKDYFSKMEGMFYSDGMNPEFQHRWPIIVPAGTHAYTYNDVCDMGCRRMKHYDLYNKQFEFFCPIWLEHMSGDIVFEFVITDSASKNMISAKRLTIKKDMILNSFDQYFQTHVANSGVDKGTDRVMNINFDKSSAFISGFDVKNGIHVTKDVSNLTNIITSRERPLMEFDNILLTYFSNNNIILNQLFNFNFCFNISDLTKSVIDDIIIGEDLSISVNVYVDGKRLPMRDFDTEYDFIPKDVITTDNSISESINILNYLIDYKCIDLIDKNKYSQDICHWSLCDNNDYIFNLYDGFSGYSVENGVIIESKHQYGKTPSLDTPEYNQYTNNTGWTSLFKYDNWADIYLFLAEIGLYKDKLTVYDGRSFVNGIKYTKAPQRPIYFCGIEVNPKLYIKLVNQYEHTTLDDGLVVMVFDDVVIFLTNDIRHLTHRKMVEIFGSLNCDGILAEFVSVFMSYITPSAIVLKSSLLASRYDGPNSLSDEMTYYKDNTHSGVVLRYDGKIKPTFTTKRTMYYKDYISDDKSSGISKLQASEYGKYVITGYEPLYKSIGYYAIRSRDIDYENIPMVNVSEFDHDVKLIQTPEYKWFNRCKMLYVEPACTFTLVKEKGDDVNQLLLSYIREHYHTDDPEYIKGLYDIQYDWDYASPHNVDEYIYNITMKLK
jgi:hypothetical protein